MEKDYLIEVTNKLYKLTFLFPKKEPLRYKMREVAGNILEKSLVRINLKSPNPGSFAVNGTKRDREMIFEIENSLGIIDGYFEIIKWQNWANYFDVTDIQEKYEGIYNNLKEEIKTIVTNEPKDEKIIVREEQKENEDLIPRKKKILTFLKESGRAQVSEINKVLPSVSKRTLRRDVQDLCKNRLIYKVGEKNNTFYQIREI